MNVKFKSLLIKTDVTAIKIAKHAIFAAVGSHLHIFRKDDYHHVNKIRIFDGIHCYGIETNTTSDQLLIYGENRIKIFNCKSEISELCEQSTTDWIITAKWALNGDIVALLMHNTLIVFNSNLEEKCRYICEENCLLYSGFISYDNFDQLIIFSGTVFSEVLLWRPTVSKNGLSSITTRLKGHKGVIFSIHCVPSLNLICTSSDDRTAMLWKTTIFNDPQANVLSELLCTVNGHSSRIFRCHILNDLFATAGEDSIVNIWNFQGELVKKIAANKGDSVWALDYNESDKILMIGNGDASVIAVKLNNQLNIQTFDLQKVRRVTIVDDGDLLLITEDGFLFQFLKQKNQLELIGRHSELKSYALLEVSNCRKLVAFAGFYGDIFIYKKIKHSFIFKYHHQIQNKQRIFSFHWLTCRLFLTCEKEGDLKMWCLHHKNIIFLTKFLLPQSKERWSTTACFLNEKNFIVGDRKGNLHIFCIGKLQPIQTIKKVHSHLGVTFLTVKQNTVYSMGRNGIIKLYNFNYEKQELVYKVTNKLPFNWLARLEQYDRKNYLLGFTGNEFLVWDCDDRRSLLQHPCGGGHRSWDFYKTKNNAIFTFLKENTINTISADWSTLNSISLIKGFHSLEINALAVIKNQNQCVLLTGGEDTTFQLSMFSTENLLFNTTEILKSHLSSIRCISTHFFKEFYIHNTKLIRYYAVFSAGGRGQIVLWLLTLEMENNTVTTINCYEKYSYYESLANDESEMRIMDMTTIKRDSSIILFAACSDGKIKVFHVKDIQKDMKLVLKQTLAQKLNRCILKISSFVICNQTVLVSMNSEGKIAFWNIENLVVTEPFFDITAHQSGINSYSYKIVNNLCMFLTGGDDNAIILHVLSFNKDNNDFIVKILCKYMDVSSHCAQITGTFLTDHYFITTSIDQKVLVFQWNYSDTLFVNLIGRYNSVIADIQGLQVLTNTNDSYYVILYGKGIEIIQMFLLNKVLE